MYPSSHGTLPDHRSEHAAAYTMRCISAGRIVHDTSLYMKSESKNPGFVQVKRSWEGNPEEVREEMARVTREEFRDGRFYQLAAVAVASKPGQV
jgi:late competence protein required for DNA uptake (superfamily II DNA/RNA helicase)